MRNNNYISFVRNGRDNIILMQTNIVSNLKTLALTNIVKIIFTLITLSAKLIMR